MNIASVSSATTTTTDSTSSSDLSSTDFMTLLLAQLENQDPLNPMEDTEMLAELAQFSNLEQLVELNETMETVADTVSTMFVTSAVSFIGLEVTAEGNTITKGEDGTTDLTYTLEDTATTATAYIYNEDGDLVTSVELEELSEGEHTFDWDGLDDDGEELEDGIYSVSILAYDAESDSVSVSMECQGTVVGMTSLNGSAVYELDNGSYVDVMSISSVTSPS